jgi:carboxyl-terminal processing protease
MKLLIIIVMIAGTSFTPWAGRTQTGKEISPVARAYLQEALDTLQKNSIRKKSVDWNAVRDRAFKAAAGAELPTDTYDAIRLVLRELRDNRSSLELSKTLRDQEAARKPNKTGQFRLDPIRPSSSLDVQRGPEGYVHRIGGRTVARVVVPAYEAAAAESSATELRATQLQKVITDLDAANPCGWMIDLRGNTSGDLWPMLAGIGPVLGDGVVGGFRDADGNLVKWFYKDGKSGIRDLFGVEHNLASVAGQGYRLKSAALIAVLIDRKTINSAEAIAVTFRGRPRTRFFGEPISITSATEKFPLSDGANLVLTVGVYVDRAGGEYSDGLPPDEPISTGNKNPREGEDPVIHAALGWIGEQAECQTK